VAIGLETEVRGLRETLVELKTLDKTLYDQLNSDIKNAATPFAQGIQNALPKTSPLTGFTHSGATAFRSSDNKTQAKTGNKRPRGNTPVSLLKVVVFGRGLAIADMAGRRNSQGRTSGRSKSSARRPTGYRLNGQGTKMIEKLNAEYRSTDIKSKNGASRFVWPAALKNQNLIDNSIERSLQEASAKVNRNLLVVK
jgi:hypothetical protein